MPGGLSRRAFLRLVAGAGGVCLAPSLRADEPDERLRLPFGTKPSRVVLVRSEHVLAEGELREGHLYDMVERALTDLTGAADLSAAWRSVLKPEDVIGLKFNRSGQAALATSEVMAQTLIGSLTEAGFDAGQIVCIECPWRVAAAFGTASPEPGFDEQPTDFGSGTDQLAAVLRQVTAIVNVPFAKTHNIAGLTCCLKNLSHGLVKHPARYHANGCSPYVADIVALEAIRGKLRLNLVDALRPVFDGGPEPTHRGTADEGAIIASFDPVAADTVCLGLLNEVRRARGLPLLADMPERVTYLAEAHRKGIGIAVEHGIDLVRRTM